MVYSKAFIWSENNFVNFDYLWPCCHCSQGSFSVQSTFLMKKVALFAICWSLFVFLFFLKMTFVSCLQAQNTQVSKHDTTTTLLLQCLGGQVEDCSSHWKVYIKMANGHLKNKNCLNQMKHLTTGLLYLSYQESSYCQGGMLKH